MAKEPLRAAAPGRRAHARIAFAQAFGLPNDASETEIREAIGKLPEKGLWNRHDVAADFRDALRETHLPL